MTEARPARTGALLLLAELGLVAVHLAAVVGFGRLYRGGGWAADLAVFVLVAHVSAAAGRRSNLRAPVVAGWALASIALTAAWALFPETCRFGLPTGDTLRAAGDAIHAARLAFPKVVAPTPALPGFQLVAGVVLAGAVWFADWAAFRLRTTAEAVAPAGVLFAFVTLLGADVGRGTATVAFVGAVLAFVACHRAWRAATELPWAGGPADGSGAAAGSWAVLRGAVAVVVVAGVLGVVVGPRLPGSDADPLVSWRHRGNGDGPRVTVSPMVELRKRLIDQSDVELFTVRSNREAYWRLTALDRFDGNIWSSSGRFSPAGEELPQVTPAVDERRLVTQQFQIEALSAIWVPAAFQARGLPRSSEPLRWDPQSATLIVESSQPSSNGLTYTVRSEVPRLDRTTLERPQGPDDPALAERYEALPGGFPDEAARIAREVTAGSRTRYQQARSLQDWFRSQFTYSLEVPAGHSDDALLSFLASRSGYCEQFAGAYAAMARSLGIPARVAVGFTPGEVDPADPTLRHVRGRQAHAWPEVWFPKVGWVPFEPTPGRGMPDARAYTGVVPVQDDRGPSPTITTQPADDGQTPTTRASATTEPNRRATTTAPARSDVGAGAASPTTTDAPASHTGRNAVLVLVLVALAAVVLLARRRRASARPRPDHPVLGAWHDAVRAAARADVGVGEPAASETVLEYAERAGASLADEPGGVAAAEALAELAELTTEAAWSPDGPTDREAAVRAEALAATVAASAREVQRSRGGSSRRRRPRMRSAFSPK